MIRLLMDSRCSSNIEVENELARVSAVLESDLGLDLSKLHNLSIARTWKRGRKVKTPPAPTE